MRLSDYTARVNGKLYRVAFIPASELTNGGTFQIDHAQRVVLMHDGLSHEGTTNNIRTIQAGNPGRDEVTPDE